LEAGGGGRAGSVLVSDDVPGPPPLSAVSGPVQALQDDPLTDTAGRVGGEGTGDSTPGGVLQVLGGRVGRVFISLGNFSHR
jgi:hypothetical protein